MALNFFLKPAFFLCSISLYAAAQTPSVTVGSKAFTEGYLLSEIAAQKMEDGTSLRVSRKFGLGGTGITFLALKHGKIDLYGEYTGTIAEEILKRPELKDFSDLQQALESKERLVMSPPLGFNNTYALAIRDQFAKKHQIYKISDLRQRSHIRIGVSHEFFRRKDGYLALLKHYHLPEFSHLSRMAHPLAYTAIESDKVDVIDVYSTDAKIEKLGLVILKDDLHFFPRYEAVFLARQDFVKRYPDLWKSLCELAHRIDERQMIHLNFLADIEKRSFSQIAKDFLGTNQLESSSKKTWQTVPYGKLTKDHLFLVGVSLVLSLMVGLPLGVFSYRAKKAGQLILGLSAVIQTIPSLALLCFLIPLFGIGTKPAIVALFLYGLLPIIVGVHAGLSSLDKKMLESADALGLSSWQRLRMIEFPLASHSIFNGVKTSAIISIGTATLAALIGAGGFGDPIVTGLALNDIGMILSGAIPAALLALVVHVLFELGKRIVIPRGIR